MSWIPSYLFCKANASNQNILPEIEFYIMSIFPPDLDFPDGANDPRASIIMSTWDNCLILGVFAWYQGFGNQNFVCYKKNDRIVWYYPVLKAGHCILAYQSIIEHFEFKHKWCCLKTQCLLIFEMATFVPACIIQQLCHIIERQFWRDKMICSLIIWHSKD